MEVTYERASKTRPAGEPAGRGPCIRGTFFCDLVDRFNPALLALGAAAGKSGAKLLAAVTTSLIFFFAVSAHFFLFFNTYTTPCHT